MIASNILSCETSRQCLQVCYIQITSFKQRAEQNEMCLY